jgi:PAS domain S-box-containing protein
MGTPDGDAGSADFCRTLFEALFELSPDPISVNRLADGTMVMVNQAWCQMTGVPKEEAIGQSSPSLGLAVHPEEWEDLISELHEQHMNTPRVVTMRTRDGLERRLLLNASRVTVNHEDLVIRIGKDVTYHHGIEAELRESAAAFQSVFEMSPVALCLQREGRFVHLNPAAVHLFGAQEAAQVIGQPVLDRTPAREQSGLRARVQEAMAGVQETRFVETQILTLDGTEMDVEVLDRLVTFQGLPTILVSIHDIRERKQADKALLDTMTLLDRTGELAKVGGCRLDVETMQQYLTPETFRIFDLEPGDTPSLEDGLAYYALEDRLVLQAALKACIDTGAAYDLDLPATTAKGRSIWVRTQGFPMIKEGRTIEVIRVIQDITDRFLAEKEALKLEAKLHQAQKMESLGLLAGGVAHDINNVLAAILAVATIHRRRAADGTPLYQDMETITQACLRGGTLVKSLLGFARKDLHEERLLNLNDLIRQGLNLLEPLTPERVTIQADLSDSLREMMGDPAALNRALMNLCMNAFEAMPDGGTLTLRTRNEGPDALLVEVEDSGLGMAPEVLQQAMAPFYTTKQSSTDTGLGLPIVYGTIRAHRGTVDLQSEPGRGTIVRLGFPAYDSIPSEKPGVQTSGGDEASAKKSILFVDDDPLLLQAMPRAIEHLGHSVRAVTNGKQVLALIDQGFRPDLVILDVNMPGIDGLETLLQLRERAPMLPVLLSTGNPSQAVQDLVKQLSGVSLIAKPYTLEDLKRQIRMAVL